MSALFPLGREAVYVLATKWEAYRIWLLMVHGANHPLHVAVLEVLIPEWARTRDELLEQSTADPYAASKAAYLLHADLHDYERACMALPDPRLAQVPPV